MTDLFTLSETAELRRAFSSLESESPPAPELGTLHPLDPERRRSPVLVAGVAGLVALAVLIPFRLLGGDAPPVGSADSTTATAEAGATDVPSASETAPAEEAPIAARMPAGWDPLTSEPVFAGTGNARMVAEAYLTDRFPNRSSLGVQIISVEQDDVLALVRWGWGHEVDETQLEQGLYGYVILRPADDGHEVVGASTDGVDLSDVVYESGAVSGVITTADMNFLGADVLGTNGLPVPAAPFPDGRSPDADFVWGSAGGADGELMLSLSPVEGMVTLRVNLVGGTLLSISEVALSDAG